MGRPLSHRDEPLYTRVSEPVRQWVKQRAEVLDMSESHFLDSLIRLAKKSFSPKQLKDEFMVKCAKS